MASRFSIEAPGLVHDAATGLVWSRSANPLGFPLPWAEALAAIADLNRSFFLGCSDWRLPNRAELRSLADHGARQPALPAGRPFQDVFLGWCWTSTTKAGHEAYAWNMHLEGARLFYSRKDEHRLLWPVRGSGALLPRTGQARCFDAAGARTACAGTGQDGELRLGAPWPEPRFAVRDGEVLDALTGLCWLHPERLDSRPLAWEEARALAASTGPGWRLPGIRELESLVHADRADPAFPDALATLGHVDAEGFWSATSSGFDPAWAFVLYARKGAVGVGFKAGREFPSWPVRGPADSPEGVPVGESLGEGLWRAWDLP